MSKPFERFKSAMEATLPSESAPADESAPPAGQLSGVLDPFGQDWGWLDPALEGDPANAPAMSDDSVVPRAANELAEPNKGWDWWRTRFGQRRGWRIGAAAATAAAVGLLGFLLRPVLWSVPSPANPLWLLADVTQEPTDAGPGQPKTFRLESPRDGFLAVIAMHSAVPPADIHVEPEPMASEVRQVKAYQPVSYTLPGRVPAESVMFVVTPTPCEAALRRAFRQEAELPKEPDDMMKLLYKNLRGAGYGWAACGMIDVKGPP